MPSPNKLRTQDAHLHRAEAYGWRLHNPGRLLSNALRRFEDRVLELLAESGYPEARRTHVNLTRHLDLEGTRITELARRAAMTNAAMTELIDQCVQLGWVQRENDPADKRVRIVSFTSQGLKWLDAFGRAVQQAQQEMSEAMGESRLQQLMRSLARYAPSQEDKA